MKDSSFCVMAGKCAGNTYRVMAENTHKIGRCLGTTAKAAVEETEALFQRIGNLFKTIKADGQLAHWEIKRKDDLAKLGEDVFKRRESELEQLFADDNFKDILNEVNNDQSNIGRIEAEKHSRYKHLRRKALYRHAAAQIDHPLASVRLSALRVLEKFGNSDSVNMIAPLLEDPDEKVRARAQETMQRLSDAKKLPSSDSDKKDL